VVSEVDGGSSVRSTLVRFLQEAIMERGGSIAALTDETVLLESGLDSLGFAVVIARLEEEFDGDPFLTMPTAVYPRTFGELVAIYERYEREAG
jgi:hypothetical protein